MYITADAWSPGPGITLCNSAKGAIVETANCATLAGPGSGKTELLAQKANFLLRTRACPYPKRILALSFKTDATKNLRTRVNSRCAPELTERFEAFTFHGFSKSLLDRFILGLPKNLRPSPHYGLEPKAKPPDVLSYADLLPLAKSILERNASIKRALRVTYSHVFLDEFQDCTFEQFELIKLLFLNTGARLTAVGDTKQGIMRWANAVPEIFEKFVLLFEAKKYHLYINHRSAPAILDLQYRVAKILEPFADLPQVAQSGGSVLHYNFQSCQSEASNLASQVRAKVTEQNLPPQEIAILARSGPLLNPIREALRNLGLPVLDETQSLQDYLADPIGISIVAWLRLCLGPVHKAALCQVWETAYQVYSLDDVDSAKEHELLSLLHKTRKSIRKELTSEPIDSKAVSAAIRWFVKDFLGVANIRSTFPQYARGNYLMDVSNGIFKALKELRPSSGSWHSAVCTLDSRAGIRLMTIHKSKGLEFHTVYLVGLEDESFFGKDSEEEWSAFFVGISRAKEALITTYCARRQDQYKTLRYKSGLTAGFHQCIFEAGISILDVSDVSND